MNEDVGLINKLFQNTKYTAESKICSGSYGDIYRIKNTKSNKIYALKVLHIPTLKKQKKYHEGIIETIVLEKLSHPGIIHSYEVIETPEYICIVLDYCPFGDIFSLMKQISQSVALAKKKKELMTYYLAQILFALDYLHTIGVVHRDLKPQNIVLGSDLKIRIIDFGTAKVLDESFYSALQIAHIENVRQNEEENRKSLVGSAQYLSPEALTGSYSEKSDIWAFGILIYNFYHSCLPFDGESTLEVFKKIQENDVQVEQSVPPEIKQLILLCLKRNPEQRPTAKMLRICTLFKGIETKNIFTMDPPITKQEFKWVHLDKVSDNIFQLQVEKKMFFGNFKPRLLVIFKVGDKLMMAYKYIETKQTKHEFQLSMNDYSQRTEDHEFEVATQEKKYVFRVEKGINVNDVVQKLNVIIRKHYNLI